MGRTGRRRARPRGVGVPAGRRRRAAPLRPRRHRCCTRAGSRRRACSRRPSWPTPRSGWPRSARTTWRRPTRTSTRRSSGCSATSVARSTPAARATTRWRRRSGCTWPTRPPRPARRSPGSHVRSWRAPREEAETSMPGYTHLQRAIPVTVGHHLLAWVEMLERDRARFAFAGDQASASPLGAGALAGSTLRLPAPPNADAQLDRRRRRPRLRARLPVRRAPSSSRTCRGSGRSSCSGRRASSGSRACPRTPPPARR